MDWMTPPIKDGMVLSDVGFVPPAARQVLRLGRRRDYGDFKHYHSRDRIIHRAGHTRMELMRRSLGASVYESSPSRDGDAELAHLKAASDPPDLLILHNERNHWALSMAIREATPTGLADDRRRDTPSALVGLRVHVEHVVGSVQLAMSVGLVLFVAGILLARYDVFRTGFVLPMILAGATLLVSGVLFLGTMKSAVRSARTLDRS